MNEGKKSKFKSFLSKFNLKNFSLKGNKKIQIAVAIILFCVMIAIFIGSLTNKNNTSLISESYETGTESNKLLDYQSKIEKRLETILSSIKGAGSVNVMVMIETSEENIYAKNKESEKTYKDDNIENENTNEELVLIKQNGENGVVIEKIIYPKIVGVLVVADGASDPKLRLNIQNAVSVLINLETSKIEVLAG